MLKQWKQWIAGGVLVLAVAVPALAQAPRRTEAEQIKARQRISTMEGVLERAVLNGADNLLRQVASVMPDAAMLSGVPQVRGFRLEGYGLFFDVEVPALRLSIAWMVQSMQSGARVTSAALNDLKAYHEQLTDRDGRDRLARIIQRLELSLGSAAPPAGPRVTARPGSLSAAALQPQSLPATPRAVDNPDEVWTEEVKTALMEAMLESSGPLAIADDEWLTVAAKDNVPRDPLIPGDTIDLSTITFRVKGSDLAAFHSKRLSLDEVRQRVEIRED
jgi:hypothetical protein